MSDVKIAVTYEEETGEIYQHFGHCHSFKIYHTEGGEITSASVVSSGTYGHGGLATFLQKMGVDTLICGGIGGGAQNALKAAGIKFFGGVKGNADKAVKSLINDSLNYDPNVHCNHHHESGHEHSCGHHEDGQTCGHNEYTK